MGRPVAHNLLHNLSFLSHDLHDLLPPYLLHGIHDKATSRSVEDPKARLDSKAWALVKDSRTSSDLQVKTARRSVEDLKARRDPKALALAKNRKAQKTQVSSYGPVARCRVTPIGQRTDDGASYMLCPCGCGVAMVDVNMKVAVAVAVAWQSLWAWPWP